MFVRQQTARRSLADDEGNIVRSGQTDATATTPRRVRSERKTGVKRTEVITVQLVQDAHGWLRLRAESTAADLQMDSLGDFLGRRPGLSNELASGAQAIGPELLADTQVPGPDRPHG